MRAIHRSPLLVAALSLIVAALACTTPGGSAQPTAAPAATVDTSAQQPAAQEPATQEPPAGGETTGDSSGAAQPTPLPAPPAAPAPNAGDSGITFYLDNQIATAWNYVIVPADEYTQEDVNNGAPIDWLLPSHYRFCFAACESFYGSGPNQETRMYVFPVANFVDYNTVGPQRIADLTKMLHDKPQTFPDEIPVLPVFNSAQVFRAQTQYITFQNGEGIRFITNYAQAPIPILSGGIYYTFQGLTYDGKYYISLFVRLSQSDLPANYDEVVGGDDQAFFNGFDGYLSTTVQALNAADGSTFTPTLDQVDTLVNSLTVAPGG